MKLLSKTNIGKLPVYDISVEDVEHYVLENGIVTHNTGGIYSANDIWIIGRSQEKEGNDIAGYTFTINIEKSRTVKEKSKIPLTVMFDGGITKYSGLLDMALEFGYVIKPSMGWYQKVDPETGELVDGKYRAKDTNTEEFWGSLLTSTAFKDAIQKKYKVVVDGGLLDEDEE